MDYCPLNYKKYGEKGRVVVILHGLFGMLDNWNSFAKQLATQFQVYIVDQRNHGKSCHLDKMSYELMSQDLFFFMETHGLERINLVGHSMGGKVAMNFAIKYPDLVERLIVVDIAPKVYQPVHQIIFKALNAIDFAQAPSRSDVARQLAQYIQQPAIIQFLMKNLGRDDQKKLIWKMNLKVIYDHYSMMNYWEVRSGQYDGEVLFVKGEKSNYISDGDGDLVGRYFPNAQILEIKGVGHWVHAEDPNRLLQICRQFISSNI